MRQALSNCVIHTGEDIRPGGIIVVENGRIVSLPAETPRGCPILDLEGMHIAPGFIDIQLNGGEQFHFTANPTEETIEDMYRSSLRAGVTHFLPTLISSSRENILRGIEAVKNYRSKHN